MCLSRPEFNPGTVNVKLVIVILCFLLKALVK